MNKNFGSKEKSFEDMYCELMSKTPNNNFNHCFSRKNTKEKNNAKNQSKSHAIKKEKLNRIK